MLDPHAVVVNIKIVQYVTALAVNEAASNGQ